MADDSPRCSAILASAERLFLHYGLTRTTIAQIANEAAVGVGSVYLEFPSKQAIIGALASRRYGRILDEMQVIAGEHWPVRERLPSMMRVRTEEIRRACLGGPHGCDLFHSGCGIVREAHHEFMDSELGLITVMLREGLERGELANIDPVATAAVIQRAYASFSPPAMFERSERDLLAEVHALSELLFVGLLPR